MHERRAEAGAYEPYYARSELSIRRVSLRFEKETKNAEKRGTPRERNKRKNLQNSAVCVVIKTLKETKQKKAGPSTLGAPFFLLHCLLAIYYYSIVGWDSRCFVFSVRRAHERGGEYLFFYYFAFFLFVCFCGNQPLSRGPMRIGGGRTVWPRKKKRKKKSIAEES